jgi:hypothetical protein
MALFHTIRATSMRSGWFRKMGATAMLSLATTAIAVAAPPSLFYSLLPLHKSQAACLKRATAVVGSEVSGKIDVRSDNVSLVNDDFNIGVHCRATGANDSYVTIVVAHRASFNEARGVALNIRRGMETGVIE